MTDSSRQGRLRYELHECIDTGGMAEVFRASMTSDLRAPRTVAFKRLLPHVAADPKLVEMFLDEAKLALLLRHPHIVQA